MPSARLQLSVTSQTMVCVPFVRAVVSKTNEPPASDELARPGNSKAMSWRSAPNVTGCNGPESIETCTPPGPILHVATPPTGGVRAQPKFTAVPALTPPMPGVSIEPNGLVAVWLLTTIAFCPSVLTFDSSSNAKADKA